MTDEKPENRLKRIFDRALLRQPPQPKKPEPLHAAKATSEKVKIPQGKSSQPLPSAASLADQKPKQPMEERKGEALDAFRQASDNEKIKQRQAFEKRFATPQKHATAIESIKHAQERRDANEKRLQERCDQIQSKLSRVVGPRPVMDEVAIALNQEKTIAYDEFNEAEIERWLEGALVQAENLVETPDLILVPTEHQHPGNDVDYVEIFNKAAWDNPPPPDPPIAPKP